MRVKRLRLVATVILVSCVSACSNDSVGSWTLAEATNAKDTTLSLLVHEGACSSGRSAEGRIQEPEVDYQPDSVTITIKVDYIGGNNTCPGGPPTPFTLKLSEPLGTRALLDGGREPAATVTPPQ